MWMIIQDVCSPAHQAAADVHSGHPVHGGPRPATHLPWAQSSYSHEVNGTSGKICANQSTHQL